MMAYPGMCLVVILVYIIREANPQAENKINGAMTFTSVSQALLAAGVLLQCDGNLDW